MSKKGITLVALVITIVVLLILSGITITLTVGQRGILTKAQQAGKNYVDASKKEVTDLDEMYSSIEIATNGDGKITLDKEQLNEYINGIVEQKTSNKFIDTNNKITEIGQIDNYDGASYSYTATEDCVVATILLFSNAGYGTYLNDEMIGIDTNTGSGFVSHIYYLKNGDKLELKTEGGLTAALMKIYGIK